MDNTNSGYSEDSSRGETFQFTDETTTPTGTVLKAVSEVTGTEETSLAPLYRVVDPDALNKLIAGQSTEQRKISVSFIYAGHHVAVRADGSVTVSPVGNEGSDATA